MNTQTCWPIVILFICLYLLYFQWTISYPFVMM